MQADKQVKQWPVYVPLRNAIADKAKRGVTVTGMILDRLVGFRGLDEDMIGGEYVLCFEVPYRDDGSFIVMGERYFMVDAFGL